MLKKILIELPEEVAKKLSVLGINADSDRKNYIQDLLIKHVKK